MSFKVDQKLRGSGLTPDEYDYFENNPTPTTDVFTYKLGGSAGDVVATITITYTDNTKCEIVSAERS